MLLSRVDARIVGDCLADLGARVTAAECLTHANVQAALDYASGEIEAACLVAGKYTPTDLAALTGMSAAFLQGLCCDLAVWHLLVRRYPTVQPTEAYKLAQEMLSRLRLGERIFGLQEQADAGLPNTTYTTQANIDTQRLNTTLSSRYFGVRGKERRLGP